MKPFAAAAWIRSTSGLSGKRKPILAENRITYTNLASTRPISPKSTMIWSPGLTGTGTTQVPVRHQLALAQAAGEFGNSLASQVSATRGSPSTAAPEPVATSLPFL